MCATYRLLCSVLIEWCIFTQSATMCGSLLECSAEHPRVHDRSSVTMCGPVLAVHFQMPNGACDAVVCSLQAHKYIVSAYLKSSDFTHLI